MTLTHLRLGAGGLALRLMLGLGLLAGSCAKQDAPAGSNSGNASKPDGAVKIDLGAPSGTGGSSANGGGSGGTGGAAPSDAAGPTMAMPPTSCGGIRNCETACKHDTACQKKCYDQAPSEAKAKYDAVRTCSTKTCADLNDEGCRCPIECLGEGACLEPVDLCVGFDIDEFCEVNCH